MADDCTLLDGYALFIQCIVGVLAVSSLFFKRHIERPQRPWIVWFFDTSKQLLAAGAMHLVNVLAATISGESQQRPTNEDACVWYLTWLLVDATLLLFLMSALLKILHGFVEQRNIVTLRHGEYGDPPRWSIWTLQLSIYALILFSAKAICLYILYRHSGVFVSIARYILYPLEGHRRLKLFTVMLIVPLIIMIFQYWLLDSLIMANWQRSTSTDWQSVATESTEDDLSRSNSILTKRYEKQMARDLTENQGVILDYLPREAHFHAGSSQEES
ncbi:hypothetical protein PSACC_02834 [Paramicrosporidium saccamoebae]|uniref:Uncharacterized protein n=1 Tax=Paramicrosporidium saccamoebae TaxID=1246581 RepID=A0A2H9THQ0_9FUNG|nr:hypothetical protein PSACC_02834 [Paramicrosporidium saccamoebae]